MLPASAQGDSLLRERICDVMALEGIRATADDIVVTVGAQQALCPTHDRDEPAPGRIDGS